VKSLDRALPFELPIVRKIDKESIFQVSINPPVEFRCKTIKNTIPPLTPELASPNSPNSTDKVLFQLSFEANE
jgi:hypothetical protein